MTEKKKMGAGLVLSVITVLVTVAGLVLYMMNCKTNYFVKTTGTDNTIVACLAVAAILEIVMIIVSDHSFCENGSKAGSGYYSGSMRCADSICADRFCGKQNRCNRVHHDF